VWTTTLNPYTLTNNKYYERRKNRITIIIDVYVYMVGAIGPKAKKNFSFLPIVYLAFAVVLVFFFRI